MGALEIPSRLELKYVVSPERARELAGLIAPFCELDGHSAAAPDRQYAICSLYLDDERFSLHRASRAKSPGRFKARVRSYEGSSEPVFLEVKRKTGHIVRKTRALTPREAWAERLAGTPAPDASPAELSFRAFVEGYGLRPRLLVRYRREAWCGRFESYSRVTFDREVTCQPCSDWRLRPESQGSIALDDFDGRGARGGVLLELKCTPDVPRWMESLVHRLELERSGFSKYCTGIDKVWGGRRPSLLGALQPPWG